MNAINRCISYALLPTPSYQRVITNNYHIDSCVSERVNNKFFLNIKNISSVLDLTMMSNPKQLGLVANPNPSLLGLVVMLDLVTLSQVIMPRPNMR
jgi:hypothetical protein